LSCLADMNDYAIKTPQQLGSVLQGYRRERGLTQTEVGAKAGLAQKAVSKIELAPGRAGLSLIFKSCGDSGRKGEAFLPNPARLARD
jgi:HTH-type transcriptional regulator / antitoxin HipB